MIYIVLGVTWTMLTNPLKGTFSCVVLGILLVYVEDIVSSKGFIFFNIYTLYFIYCV